LNTIVEKRELNSTVTLMKVYAPQIARKAQPGQFIILRVDDQGERIPLTIAETDIETGLVTIIFQIVGATTFLLNKLQQGDSIQDFVGPLGRESKLEGLKRVAVIGGGVGCAIALPVARKLHEMGCVVHSVVGFRENDLVILREEFERYSDRYILVTDDGSSGRKGLVTDALRELLDAGEEYDEVIAIGPIIMMKFISALTKEYGVKTSVSMNPIMIDGTGMCGGCRLTVGGRTQFACVDGPDFDGHQVDWDEAMSRSIAYRDFERAQWEHVCSLNGEVSG